MLCSTTAIVKNRIYTKPSVALALMVFCSQIAPVLLAQNPAPDPSSQLTPAQLPAHVRDVLKLVHGDVSEGVMIAYIKNSGKVYSLGAPEILYLREQGVSDQVLTAMLNQRQTGADTSAHAAPQATPTAQPAALANVSSPQYAVAATQSPPNYVEAAPVYAQPAPLYVYPATYGYYDYWPSYAGYWGYPWLSCSFGYWGGHYYGGGHHGGYYHGDHRGGYYAGGHHPGVSYSGGGNNRGYSGGNRGPGHYGGGMPVGSSGVGRPGSFSGGSRSGGYGYSGGGPSFGSGGGGRSSGFSGGGRSGGFSGGGRWGWRRTPLNRQSCSTESGHTVSDGPDPSLTLLPRAFLRSYCSRALLGFDTQHLP